MSQEKIPSESALVIESGLSPMQSLETGIVVANVRGKISYNLQMIGSRRWKVTLTRGSMDDLRKAVSLSRGVRIIEGKGG